MKTISVVLIVKNEEALLARCLNSVKDADEIIICDTGSTDKTIEIAKQYTDKIYTDFVWCDSFEKARNHAKSKATKDWILSIDADEVCHDFSKVREAIEIAKDCVGVYLDGEGAKAGFRCPRLFRNTPDIAWFGAIHNHIGVTKEGDEKGMNVSGSGELVGDVRITYGYSPAHQLDPDRSLRILLRECENDPDRTKSRERYYLGRELWYKQRYLEATKWLGEHVQITNFTAEKADSFLCMSRCYSTMGMDDDARDACLQAVNLNSHFKEAILFMAAISLDANAEQWKRMAETADNSNVLFVRT